MAIGSGLSGRNMIYVRAYSFESAEAISTILMWTRNDIKWSVVWPSGSAYGSEHDLCEGPVHFGSPDSEMSMRSGPLIGQIQWPRLQRILKHALLNF